MISIMRKAELTESQLRKVELVTRKLGDAGWNFDEWFPPFEAGENVWQEISGSYEGRDASLYFTCSIEAEQVTFLVGTKDHSQYVDFRVYPGDKLDELLDLVIQHQDIVSLSSYRGFVRAMRYLCGEVFWEEQGFEGPLVTDEDLEES
jgi:hypothetical protein